MVYFYALMGYLFGSIPFAKIIAKRGGVDIQKVGSGNIGFANVERQMGLKYALPVLVGDISKGLIPVILARLAGVSGTLQLSIVAASAILGHVFPVWLKFRGGKAIATSIGVSAGLNIVFGLVALPVYLISRKFIKDAAIRSLSTILSLLITALIISSPFAVFLACDFVFVIWTHRNNLREILRRHYK